MHSQCFAISSFSSLSCSLRKPDCWEGMKRILKLLKGAVLWDYQLTG